MLLDEKHAIVKSGDYTWKSSLENGVWTYHMEDVQEGLRTAIRNLGELPGKISAMGVSGMMHGYLARFGAFSAADQYMPPPMPPWAAAAAIAASALGSGLSATRDSVVSTQEAMDAAFSSAVRVTLVGSTMPDGIMSQ